MPEEESAVVASDERNDGVERKRARKCAQIQTCLHFITSYEHTEPPATEIDGAGIDGICLYLFERCATNYACLLRNAQFVRTFASLTNLHCQMYVHFCTRIERSISRYFHLLVRDHFQFLSFNFLTR